MTARHLSCTEVAVLIRIGLLVVVLAASACAKAIDATIADATVTAAVKTALLNDRSIDGTLVIVETDSGVVHLSGTQPTTEAAAAVVRIVRRVDGVRDVQSDIAVDGAPAGATTAR